MGVILAGLGFIFKDWRIMVLLAVAVVLGLAYWKYSSLRGDLEQAQQELKVEQTNNQTLRNNLTEAAKLNDANSKILEQVQDDKKQALEAISQLNKSVQQTNKSVAEMKKRVEGITAPPAPLTPYLIETIKGVQELRDAENPPPPPPK